MICNLDCFNCKFVDCVNDEEPSQQEMDYMKYIDEEIIDKYVVGVPEKEDIIDIILATIDTE